MNNEYKVKLVKVHGIKVNRDGNKIKVLESGTISGVAYTEWKDITNWTTKQVLEWLGY